MRYFLAVSYLGTSFHGSQIQGTIPTVQLALNKALSLLLGKPTATFGASRTDSDVHALENFFHFDCEAPIPENFLYRLNAILPHEIAVNNILLPAEPECANARFDAISRKYRYRLYSKKYPLLLNRAYFYPYKINREILDQTAETLKGQHDFTTFSKRKTQSKTFFCNIENAKWNFVNNEFDFEVCADRFLRGMVRALVGTQLQVARGKITVPEFENLFEKKDCTLADFSVPGFGLYLEGIEYPEKYFVAVD